MTERQATVLVIGAGQAGLSAAYHLQRSGFVNALEHPDAGRSFVVLDANPAAGGAWQHRWESLHMATVNGIFDLPGFPKPPLDADEPSREAVPRYFAAFEEHFGLPILRPVRVTSVRAADADPDGPLLVDVLSPDVLGQGVLGPDVLSPGALGQGALGPDGLDTWRTAAVINATGTWNNPLQPSYPGQSSFLGRQLHTRDYVDLAEFAGHRVAVVGGGISAVQHLEEISRVATTFWYTRREPTFLEGEFEPETTGRDTIARVTADAEAGKPGRSVVSYTGLGWTPYAIAARDRGVLDRREMFLAIEPHGVREADGSFTSVDTILWATGFQPAIAHLKPLQLRNALGGVQVVGTRAAADHRIHLIGFGPSQSTVGANRAGGAAVRELVRMLASTQPV